eukprot:XP_001701645.1 predicted protein [Chlamydomonas reinhardtii]
MSARGYWAASGVQEVATDVLPDRFLVKLRPKSGKFSTRGSSNVQSRAQQIVGRLRTAKLAVRLTHEFSTAWEGFGLQADDVDSALAALDEEYEVLSIYPVTWLPAPDSNVSEVDAAALRGVFTVADASAPTNGTTARLAAGGFKRLDGWDVKVGIVDTGVDYRHPALGGGFGPGFKVAYGRDFAGDAFKPGGVPAPDADPALIVSSQMDCAGHGTHVAGIIAGSYSSADWSFSGVAPGVTLGAYKVFGCTGGTTSELVVAALDAAAADGMQVINLSLGDEGAWGGPVAEAAARLAGLGVLVVAAVGNAGPSGLFMPTSAASASGVLGVAAVQSRAAPVAATLTVSGVRSARAAGRDFAIAAAFGDVGSLANAIVRPSDAALIAGVAAVPGSTAATGSADGCSPAGQGQTGGNGATQGSQGRDSSPSMVMVTGSLASPFSSWGPTPDLHIEPMLAAPGGAVLSTVPIVTRADGSRSTGYAYLSGTSQSAPYVAAAAALYLQANKARQVSAAQLELGSGLLGRGNLTFNMDAVNRAAAPITFRLLHLAASTIDGGVMMTVDRSIGAGGPNNSRVAQPFSPVELPYGAATVAFANTRARVIDTVTLPGRGRVRFRVTLGVADWVAPDAQLFLSGYVVLEPRPPAAQELRLHSATYGGQYLGYVSLTAQPLRRPADGSPLLLAWRGTYFDVNRKREVQYCSGGASHYTDDCTL